MEISDFLRDILIVFGQNLWMAVAIRLTRFGTTKRPFYRLIACDPRFPQGGRHLEILGTYDPMNISVPKDSDQKADKGIVQLKTDRIQYWLSVGAQPSETVRVLLKRMKVLPSATTSTGSKPKKESSKKKKAA